MVAFLFGIAPGGVVPALAQTGTITGVVVDAELGETLIGANVIIQGTTTGSTTDLNGRYEFEAPVGTHTLVFSYIGFNRTVVEGVEVKEEQATKIDISLTPEAVEVGEVVVEATALENTDAALLRQRQKSVAMSDAISAETISRSGAGDASAAMTKITGASVVDGKYVYIRGLGERYSSTQLNGAALPSADPDKKAFQLDLFPSNLLDNIVTLKTFTPDKPGDFSGGLVDIGTKNFPETFTAQLTLSSAYNTQATFADDVLTFPGIHTNALGFATDELGVPSMLRNPAFEIPNSSAFEIEARRDAEKAAQLDAVTRAFDSVMYPSTRKAFVNRSISASIGNQFSVANRPLGFTASLSYAQNSSAYNDGSVGRYELVGGSVADIDALTPLRSFGGENGLDIKGSQESDLGGLATLSYRPHPNHELSTTYLQTKSSVSSARFLSGVWQDLSNQSTFETRVIGFKERDLRSIQLNGEHNIKGVTVEWKGATARNTQDEPDLRYFSNHYTVRERNGAIDTLYQKPASLYPAPIRIFRDLEEDNRNGGLDVTIPFKQWSGFQSNLKVGGSYLDIQRDFNERQFEYREGSGVRFADFEGDDEAYFQVVGIVDTTNARYTFGNYIIETTPKKNDYTGDQTVAAGYAMLELGLLRQLRFIGGVRYESTEMTTVSADTSLPIGELNNRDWLPSANLIYALGENMNLRAAFTQTLARPTFRELAPYSTFDFVGDFVFGGNSSLKRTLITNYDLRWEWFMRSGEILAVSGFYKGFENPIERVILTSVGNNTLSVQNVDKGIVYGLELEARKRLDFITPALRFMQVGGNLSLVQSEVDIPQEELDVIREADPDASTSRSLQGQSPYLLNLDVSYDNYETGTVVGLYYNIFGDRLSTVSEGAAPDIFERSRATLDLVMSQRLLGSVNLKFSAKNLLDDPVLFSQEFKEQEFSYSNYRYGRTLSLGITYALD
ncbi:MAG TPA: TonB-dependent receptor [Rhodothermales bacterium]|nr:TonB-dependent receptor [Rhodothermales bacterium]